MKLVCFVFIGCCLSLVSCHKSVPNSKPPTEAVYFTIIGKDNKNIIDAVDDKLTAQYIQDGIRKTIRFTIFKVQVSASDATSITGNKGFIATDHDAILGLQGDMTNASSLGVRDFELYLNGEAIGTIYLDYWAFVSVYQPQTSAAFLFNGLPGQAAYLPGFYNNDTGNASNTEDHTYPPGNYSMIFTAK